MSMKKPDVSPAAEASEQRGVSDDKAAPQLEITRRRFVEPFVSPPTDVLEDTKFFFQQSGGPPPA
jgi:hypothetical protein